LRKIMWFGIIQIAGLVAGSIVAFYAFAAVFLSIASLGLGANPTPAQVGAALGPFFQSFVFVVPVTVIVDLMATVILMFALRDLAGVDRDKFSTPSILIIIGIAGILLAGAGGTLVLGSLPDLISRATVTPGGALPPSFLALFGSLGIDFVLVGLGGILALVGLIGGQILGLWRVGTRYNETTIKVGAIFTIIPLLNIVGPILVLIGALEAKGRLAKP